MRGKIVKVPHRVIYPKAHFNTSQKKNKKNKRQVTCAKPSGQKPCGKTDDIAGHWTVCAGPIILNEDCTTESEPISFKSLITLEDYDIQYKVILNTSTEVPWPMRSEKLIRTAMRVDMFDLISPEEIKLEMD